MTAQSFDMWLEAYGRAWIDGDPEAVVQLFTKDAAYFETPFDPPMIGHDTIRTYWHEGAELGQRDVRFSHDVVAVEADVAIARWHAVFVRTDDGTVVELDGVLLAEFDDAGRCRQFREWWHRR
ncbi:hypothetical protein BH23ACT10_BH23ACT10_22980 [soil metagenome]